MAVNQGNRCGDRHLNFAVNEMTGNAGKKLMNVGCLCVPTGDSSYSLQGFRKRP